MLDGVFSLLSGGKDQQATRAQDAAVRELRNLQLPSIEDMKVQLEELVLQGQLNPEQAQAILMERSQMEDVQTDPMLKNAQLQALGQLQEIGSEGGMTAMDRAKLAELQGNLASQEKGQRESLMQSAQQRGMGNSDMALAQQMLNQQSSAQNASQQGMDIAALAQQRALDAIMQSGQLGGQIRGQDFDEQSRKAQAQDMINQFNTQNRQSTLNQNVDRTNRAQEMNLAQRQGVADSNVATRNQQQQFNKGLQQQDFENRYKKAGGTAQALQTQAQALGQQGTARQNVIGGLVESGAKAYAASDINAKKDVREFNPSEFLDELTAYKYSYKKPEEYGEGEQVGVMSQDLKKVAPQAISKDEKGTEVVDYNKLGGPIMAALASLNERLKDIENG